MNGGASVGRVLYRQILRFAKAVETIPFEDGEAAGDALDRGFDALRTLHTEYSELLQRMRALREDRGNRAGVDFHIGQVFRHKKYGYRAVVYGWDRSCDRDPQWAQEMGVRAEQPFAAALPDEGDCLRIFGGVRISKYVAQENMELLHDSRVTHRSLDHYFSSYSKQLGRYIPNRKLQFEYPDCYKADDPQPCAQDANLLLHEEVEVAASAAGQGADALAHLRSEQGARDA